MTLDMITADSPIRGLAEELQRQLATKRDLMADTRRISLDALEPVRQSPRGLDCLVDMPDGVEAFAVTRHAHGQIASHIGVNWKLYERLQDGHPDLLSHLANGLLTREPSKRMLRTMDGQVRAFLSDRYRPRDNWDLLEQAILPTLGEHPGPVAFRKCDLTETRLYVKIGLPEFELPVTPKVGDVIHGGVIVSNSEVGAGALMIAPYTTVLRCTNGMVHTEFGQRRVHLGKRIEGVEEAWEMYSDETLALDDAAFFAKCRDTLRGVLNETVFQVIVGQMRELAGIRPSGAPDKVVEILAAKHGLTGDEQGSMLGALIEGADLSAWGILNSITATARDLDDSDRQVELETLAGRMLADQTWATALAVA